VSHRVGVDRPRNSRPQRGLIPGPCNVAKSFTEYAMPENWRNCAERENRCKCSRNVSTVLCPPKIAHRLAWYRNLTSRCKYSHKSVSSH
jgi:hypothetical protein